VKASQGQDKETARNVTC